MGRIKRKTNPAFAIVADGKTEIWYLQMMKKYELENKQEEQDKQVEQDKQQIRLTIKPELPKKKRIEDLCELVCKLAQEEYDKVFWIVDLDQIKKEQLDMLSKKKKGKGSKKSKKDPMRTFIECREKVLHGKKYAKRVRVIVNNPCLEFWFLLHFIYTAKAYKDYKEMEEDFKKHMKDYDKNEDYYKAENNDIYSKLKPYLNTAMEHSDRLGSFEPKDPLKAVSEMPQFFRTEELNGLF